jgi:hypothetical protein
MPSSAGDARLTPTSKNAPPPSEPEPVASDDKPDASAPVEISHGDEPAYITARREAEKEAAKDPWGATPLQMRDQHDPGVDPTTDDSYDNRTVAPDGIEPAALPDGQPPLTGGTLPPV